MTRIYDPFELIVGTSQIDRLPAPLTPNTRWWPKLDDRTEEDLARFASEFSKIVVYYDHSNQPDGNWTPFFDTTQDSLNPHYLLFLSFLQSYKLGQQAVNGITARHLALFYKDVLGFTEHPAVPDKVHVLFDLKKGCNLYRIDADTGLNAGKDSNGQQLIYRTDDEIIVNRAEISAAKSVYLDQYDRYHVRQEVRRTPKTDADGNTVYESWPLFGEQLKDVPKWTNPDLDYELGFAIGNANFESAEGERIFSVLLSTETPEENICFFDSEHRHRLPLDDDSLQIFFSGEKDWIGPFNIESDLALKSNIGTSSRAILLHIKVPVDSESIVGYTPELQGTPLETSLPVMRVMVNPRAYKFAYPHLFNFPIRTARVVVQVGLDVADPLDLFGTARHLIADDTFEKAGLLNTGIKNISVKNDQGQVNPGNPLQPFGTTPVIESSLEIKCPELFKKDNVSAAVSWEWIGIPVLEKLYRNYTNGTDDIVVAPEDFTATVSTHGLIEGESAALSPRKQISLIYPHFAVTHSQKGADGSFRLKLDGPPENRYEFTGFGHAEYANLFTSRIMYNSKYAAVETAEKSLPDKPWVPLLKDLTVRYLADASLLDDKSNKTDFFHINPFGNQRKNLRAPQGAFLMPCLYELSSNEIEQAYLKPIQLRTAHFHYIGLKNVRPPQRVSILFQMEEGGGDSENESPAPDIVWSYLSNNEWKPFGDSEIGPDTTNGLMSSGIISFSIADSANDDNSIMPQGSIWIRAEVNGDPAGLSRAIGIHPQAVCATNLWDESNLPVDPSVGTLAPGTITKPFEKDANVKKVVQPYASFGGAASESNELFYQRVCERLRHRDRSVDRWDYERKVLQAFPRISKLKCLNHTNRETHIAPGKVSLVVIPDLKRNTILDMLQPKFNSGFLADVDRFVSAGISMFVSFDVQNPLYEAIRVHTNVRFYRQYDPGYYTKVLNDDLVSFLAPWTNNASAEITFGGVLYRSQIIDFIEERPYVDKLKDLWIEQLFTHTYADLGIGYMKIRDDADLEYNEVDTFVVGSEVKVAHGTTPRSVLTSVSDHHIKIWNES